MDDTAEQGNKTEQWLVPEPAQTLPDLNPQFAWNPSALFLKRDGDKGEREYRDDIGDAISQKGKQPSQAVENTAKGATKQKGHTLGELSLCGNRWQVFLPHHLWQAGDLGNVEEDEERALYKRDEVEL